MNRRRSLFLAFTVLLYLAFLTQNFFWDGVMFSLQIEQVFAHHQTFAVLFHANHLLYSAFGYLLYAGAQLCHIPVRAITLLQIWNALVAVGVAYRIWTWSEKLTNSRDVALFSAALFAFGATWWKFATDTDPYIIAVRLLLLAVLFAAESHTKVVPAALCQVGAMLFHELAVFGYAPVLVALWTSRKRPRDLVAYITVTAAVTLACYYVCYRAGAYATHPILLHWVTNYASDTNLTHSVRQVIGENFASYGKLFAGGKLSTIRQQRSLVPIVSLLLAGAALGWGAVQLRTPAHRFPTPIPPRIRWILWSWLLPYAIFLAWFDPGNAGHKLFLWPPLVLLLATAMWSQAHARALAIGAIALAAWNFGAFIFPHSHRLDDPLLSLAQRIDKGLPRNAIVYYSSFVSDDWYLDYFAPGRTWQPLPASLPDSSTVNVCFDATALNTLNGRIVTDPKLSWQFVDKQHNIRLACRAEVH